MPSDLKSVMRGRRSAPDATRDDLLQLHGPAERRAAVDRQQVAGLEPCLLERVDHDRFGAPDRGVVQLTPLGPVAPTALTCAPGRSQAPCSTGCAADVAVTMMSAPRTASSADAHG